MKIVILGIFMGVCAPALSWAATAPTTSPFDAFEGCYMTIQWNGKAAPGPSDPDVQTEIKKEDSPFYKDVSQKAIPAMNFVIFQNTVHHQDVVDYTGIYLDRGTFSSSGKAVKYDFSGDLLLDDGSAQLPTVEMTESVAVTPISATRIGVQVYRKATGGGMDLNANDRYVLEKTTCLEW